MKRSGKNICKNARTGQPHRLNGSGNMIEKTRCANCGEELTMKQVKMSVGKLRFCSYICYAQFYHEEEDGD
jgi:hypothetical protein